MRYHANPAVEVEAKKITQIDVMADGSLALTLDDGSGFIPVPGMLSRIGLLVGDYVVTQLHDGYVYLNPKAVFERKYLPGPYEQFYREP